MSIRDAVRRLTPYRFRAQPEGVKLDQNEFPRDLPDRVRARALQALQDAAFHRYPEIHAHSLRDAIARVDGWSPDGVVVAGGSNVLIQSLVIAAGVGRRVVTVQPTFSVYALQAKLLADSLTEVPLADGFALPSRALAREVERGQGVLFLANPAAPTGNRHADEEVAQLVAAADANRWLVVLDEAYWQFSGRNHADLLSRFPHVVLLRTLSKAYGLGGVRLGYALTHPEVATHLQKALLPFSVSALQTAVGLAALEDASYVDTRVRAVVQERGRVAEVLGDLPHVEVFPSVTNFLLFRVPDADAVYDALLERGVVVRKQHGAPGLDGCLRVSIGMPDENDRFLDAIRSVSRQREIHA